MSITGKILHIWFTNPLLNKQMIPDSDMPTLCEDQPTNAGADVNDSSDEENWEEEDEIGGEPTVCLFCQQDFKNIQPIALDHLRNIHSVDLVGLKAQLSMDQYSFIRVRTYTAFLLNRCC